MGGAPPACGKWAAGRKVREVRIARRAVGDRSVFCVSLIPSIAVRPCIWRFLRYHPLTTPVLLCEGQRVRSLDTLAHPGNSYNVDGVAPRPERARRTACRDDFHNAYFEDGVQRDQPCGLGRTGKHFGPETWGLDDLRRSERPRKRPKQLVHDRRGRSVLFLVVSPPQRGPQKINNDQELPSAGSMCT